MHTETEFEQQLATKLVPINDLTDDTYSEYVFIDYLENKKIRMLAIENEMQELSEIFSDIKTLIERQDSLIHTIDDNIISAEYSVIYAEQELQTAETYQKKTRSYYKYVATGSVAIAGILTVLIKLMK
jgi:t-SNARE complex subunit (syntaxin)